MNILSISQAQTQTSRADLPPVAPMRQNDAEKLSSFADLLRDARNEQGRAAEDAKSERADDKPLPRDAEKVAVREEERPEQVAAQKDDEPSDERKIEKIARNSRSDDEEDDGERLYDGRAAEETGESLVMAALGGAHGAETDDGFKQNPDIDDAGVDADKKILPLIADSADYAAATEEIADEVAASVIASAVEFSPDAETEREMIAAAQSPAQSDGEILVGAENVGALVSGRDAGMTEQNSAESGRKVAAAKPLDEKKGARIAVHDLRSHRLLDESDARTASDKIVQKSAEKKEISLSLQRQSEGNVQMTMELAARAQENITSSSAQAAGATGSDFQQMLASAVQENAPDFVRAGNIILKDNNQGTISLVLRPEGLGNVRISLNLDDRSLSAQITVQTREAMDAFRESIPSLKQAFAESGFETGSFDLDFSQSQQGFAQGGDDGQNHRDTGSLARRSYGDFVTAGAVTGEAADSVSGGDYSVNIVA